MGTVPLERWVSEELWVSLPAITTSVSTCMDERAALTSAIVRTCRKRFPVAQKGFAGEYSQTLRGAVVAAASSRGTREVCKYERCSEARRCPGGGCAPCAATLLSLRVPAASWAPPSALAILWRTTETLGLRWACRVHPCGCRGICRRCVAGASPGKPGSRRRPPS